METLPAGLVGWIDIDEGFYLEFRNSLRLENHCKPRVSDRRRSSSFSSNERQLALNFKNCDHGAALNEETLAFQPSAGSWVS